LQQDQIGLFLLRLRNARSYHLNCNRVNDTSGVDPNNPRGASRTGQSRSQQQKFSHDSVIALFETYCKVIVWRIADLKRGSWC
jgi:hypothetical protein